MPLSNFGSIYKYKALNTPVIGGIHRRWEREEVWAIALGTLLESNPGASELYNHHPVMVRFLLIIFNLPKIVRIPSVFT